MSRASSVCFYGSESCLPPKSDSSVSYRRGVEQYGNSWGHGLKPPEPKLFLPYLFVPSLLQLKQSTVTVLLLFTSSLIEKPTSVNK